MKLKHLFFCLAIILLFAAASFSQIVPLDEKFVADRAITTQLRHEGVKYEMKRAVVWAEKDSLTQDEIKEFSSLVNQGIIGIEKYLSVKVDKKHYRAKKIEYFISSKAGISHTSSEDKPFVYIRPIKVKDKQAPYIHETTHVIAWKTESLWLSEGFASHVQTYVSKHYGGYGGYPFNPENKDIDQLAKIILKVEISKKVLPLIGLNGLPYSFNEEQSKMASIVFEDRKVAAPAFYNLSESFVKFLVEKVGMKKLRKIYEAADSQASILKLTGKIVDEWKTDWLKSLT
ncbi:MAG: hypothetical protein ACR2IH_03325 [Pyrinomonadaceae bacterium]